MLCCCVPVLPWFDSTPLCVTARLTLPFIPCYVGPLLNCFAFVSLTLCWNTMQCQMEFVFFQQWWATHSGRCSFSHCGETVNIYVIQSFWRTEDEENNVVTPTLKATIMCSVRANTLTNQFLLHKMTVSNHRLKKKGSHIKVLFLWKKRAIRGPCHYRQVTPFCEYGSANPHTQTQGEIEKQTLTKVSERQNDYSSSSIHCLHTHTRTETTTKIYLFPVRSAITFCYFAI